MFRYVAFSYNSQPKGETIPGLSSTLLPWSDALDAVVVDGDLLRQVSAEWSSTETRLVALQHSQHSEFLKLDDHEKSHHLGMLIRWGTSFSAHLFLGKVGLGELPAGVLCHPGKGDVDICRRQAEKESANCTSQRKKNFTGFGFGWF